MRLSGVEDCVASCFAGRGMLVPGKGDAGFVIMLKLDCHLLLDKLSCSRSVTSLTSYLISCFHATSFF